MLRSVAWMTNRRIVELGSLGTGASGGFAAGPFGSAVSSKNFVTSGTPMLRGSNLSLKVGVRLEDSDMVFVPDELANNFPRCIVGPGDLIFTCWGTIGQVGLIDEGSMYPRYLISNKQMKMTPDTSVADSTFLYYYLSQAATVKNIQGQAIGSSVPGFNLGQLKALKVLLPDLEKQRAIAEVLGALDDKIAANRTSGRIAVELADTLFAAAVAGIPMSDTTFEDLASIGGGGTPKTSVAEYWGDEVNWATPTDITALNLPYLGSTSRSISREGLAACSSALYPRGSILMTSRATIGAFAIAEIDTAVNQGFIVVNAKEPHLQSWLFHEMRSRVDEFISHANGATFMELPRGKFKKLTVRLSSPESIQRFTDEVQPLHRFAAQIDNESRILAKTRDELLPLLMSGKLRVKDAEKKVEAIA
ncbi:restriction endonuclease subunit S [Nocardia vinacea]|uniref:restriction endonuclease subunit S n=1 Tax=Nocardia vinacea TaxID=96468 RepID=UPI0033EC1058